MINWEAMVTTLAAAQPVVLLAPAVSVFPSKSAVRISGSHASATGTSLKALKGGAHQFTFQVYQRIVDLDRALRGVRI